MQKYLISNNLIVTGRIKSHQEKDGIWEEGEIVLQTTSSSKRCPVESIKERKKRIWRKFFETGKGAWRTPCAIFQRQE